MDRFQCYQTPVGVRACGGVHFRSLQLKTVRRANSVKRLMRRVVVKLPRRDQA